MALFKRTTIYLLCLLFFVVGCSDKHFITDKQYRDRVHQDFEKRKEMAKGREKALFSIFKNDITTEEREAMEFLYAYMPLSDLADYDGNFFLSQTRKALEAREYFKWGKTVPEEIFRHFVLVYRVNNENLDTARSVFFDALKERIVNLSMYEAALEVNHWCHEKVTYRASDGRTSSPLATMRTGMGRCGEESTFTVTALRSVGIPARQCYTPRWAHTDDNHAWVEVWVDGKWYYMGACEPDPALNMGWFSIPATRTMMVHSNVFGKYNGTEEINHQTDLFSRINMLSNYTKTKKIHIFVVDSLRNPVKEATVKFKLYNYAEYYPIASQSTNSHGEAQLTTGMGDLMIWASDNNRYNYAKMDVRKQDTITLQLCRTAGKEYTELLTICPPEELPVNSNTSAELVEQNNRRLHNEDSIRNYYISSFMKAEEAAALPCQNLTEQQKIDFIIKSEGNYAEIARFINNNGVIKTDLFLNDFLASLSDKDLRDASADVLQQHLTLFKHRYPFEVYSRGIISPRISNECLRPWRTFLSTTMRNILKDKVNSEEIQKWINDNITLDNDANYFNCPISPQGVYELRYSDQHSRDIFFVAVCRSLDIPSYLDAATNRLYVYENSQWNSVNFEVEAAKPTGTLVLNYEQKNELTPVYWTHYTIAQYDNGDFITFDFENDPRTARFPITLELESGYYLLSTGNRYSDGTTLSRLEFFNIKPGQKEHKELILRDLEARNLSYGKVDLNYTLRMDGKETKVEMLVKEKPMVLCFVDPTREPTKHLLKEIVSLKAAFEKWGGTFIFAVPTDKMSPDFSVSRWSLPCQCKIIEDTDGKWLHNVITTTRQNYHDNFPIVYIIQKDGTITFKSEGYRIGTGELIYKSLNVKHD